MKIDMHTHSTFSPDGEITPAQILKRAKEIGLDGVCIADHNATGAFADARELASELGLLLVRGCEISTSEGHLLAYGVDAPLERGIAPELAVKKIAEMGGVSVIAHPYRTPSGLGEKISRGLKADAVEVVNGGSSNGDNRKAEALAAEMKLPGTGGSDGHELPHIGKAWTVFSEPVSSEEDVLEAVRKGRVSPGGAGATSSERAGLLIRSASKWAKRGFKRV